jgi:hypothetical protein
VPDVVARRESRVASPEHRPAPRDREIAERERPPVTQDSRPATRVWLWLAAALGFTFLFVARNLAPLLRPGGAIQDDARQHVFWMLRYRDPELFRDDLIADYYQSTAPAGFAALYWVLSWVVDPILASKLLPPVLGAVTVLFTFLLVRRLHPSPAAAFLATVLLSWYAWQHDDLASASPRAFLLPTLAALLWALAAGRTVLGVGLAVLAALLYPIGGALAVALFGMRLLQHPTPNSLLPFLTAAILVAAVLVPGQLAAAPFGPTVSVEQARTMPEFGKEGRSEFFVSGAYRYWLESSRSGFKLGVSDVLFPSVPILFELAGLAALLPLLVLLRRRLPAARLLDGRTVLLFQLLAASLALFFLAHLLLFRLYLPARYVQASLPLVLAVAAGLALGIVVEEIAARAAPSRRGVLAGGLALTLAVGLALYPADYDGLFVRDPHPAVTAYLRAQPKDVLVAGVPTEADSVPALAGRRVLVAREYALPYHLGYYGQLRRRIVDLIEGYYAESPRRAADFAARYGVDLFVVNRAAFDRETFADVWAGEFEPFTSAISLKLKRQNRFALLELAHRCAVVDDGAVAVVPTACLTQATGPRSAVGDAR